ncbi:NAD(P)/FAD-dependent oxidoreductase [Planktotalea sp.]|uniref:NAD(P)/FAD-dependent oxidoreductase n=1 Tax=Planktotalea sp. TaxID=2029877 RepID=UPI003D6B0410
MSIAKQKIIVVGAGIIGAIAAYELQSAGADVLVLDAGRARATDASFGWVNASFFETQAYFALRVEGIKAYKRLQKRIDVPISWNGSLSWEFKGDEFDTYFNGLQAQGYPSRILTRAEIAALEPALGTPPARAIHFTSEAAVESSELTERLLGRAQSLGARVAQGFQVTNFVQSGGAIKGVQTKDGVFQADQVLLAAGTGTQALLATLGIALPMLHRPALVLKTRPIRAQLSHVLATDFGEVRQLPCGALLTPAAIGHQGDTSEDIGADPLAAAETAMSRLRALFPQLSIDLASMKLAHRPVPQDGFPAVGAVADGLFVATLHSGITLAPLIGELIAQEMTGGPSAASNCWLSPFRPTRFST